jgi:hypothetical protein
MYCSSLFVGRNKLATLLRVVAAVLICTVSCTETRTPIFFCPKPPSGWSDNFKSLFLEKKL